MKTKMQCAAFIAASLSATLPAFASAEAERRATAAGYQLAAITDQAYGARILAGDYSTAIAQLSGRSRRFETSTNLCVAYALSGRFDEAERACDDALKRSERSANDRQALHRRADHRDLAIALSNRGVVRAMRGDLLGALTSFARAVEVQDGFAQARNNLDRSMSAASAVLRQAADEA
jgi:tetratricopeptide (TPR) repeat protein